MTYQLVNSGKESRLISQGKPPEGLKSAYFGLSSRGCEGEILGDSRPKPCSHPGVSVKTRQPSFTINGGHAQWTEEPVSEDKGDEYQGRQIIIYFPKSFLLYF